ncbi:MAG TPA: CarD family transcriptional regulator [Gaiellaceae bacterium]|jgi:RNA polymerase-interacting CarD/CdnL/TRCF family regulator
MATGIAQSRFNQGIQAPVRSTVITDGDMVVYGSYGIGKVEIRPSTNPKDEGRDVVVLELAAGLSVTLPLERASECLRPVCNEREMKTVQSTLRQAWSPAEEPWQRRIKTARAKLVDGEAIGLADVIRDGAHRQGRPTARGEVVKLSAHERELYLKARRLLAAEIGASRGIDEEAADAWIGEQLAHTVTLPPDA